MRRDRAEVGSDLHTPREAKDTETTTLTSTIGTLDLANTEWLTFTLEEEAEQDDKDLPLVVGDDVVVEVVEVETIC